MQKFHASLTKKVLHNFAPVFKNIIFHNLSTVFLKRGKRTTKIFLWKRLSVCIQTICRIFSNTIFFHDFDTIYESSARRVLAVFSLVYHIWPDRTTFVGRVYRGPYWRELQGSGSSRFVCEWSFRLKMTIARTRRCVCSNQAVLDQLVHHFWEFRNLCVEGFQISFDSLLDQVRMELSNGFMNSFRRVSFVCSIWLLFVCGHCCGGFQTAWIAPCDGSTLKWKTYLINEGFKWMFSTDLLYLNVFHFQFPNWRLKRKQNYVLIISILRYLNDCCFLRSKQDLFWVDPVTVCLHRVNRLHQGIAGMYRLALSAFWQALVNSSMGIVEVSTSRRRIYVVLSWMVRSKSCHRWAFIASLS